MSSSFSGSDTITCTPRCNLAFCKLKSKQAILAFSFSLGIAKRSNGNASNYAMPTPVCHTQHTHSPCEATVQLRAYPFTKTLSRVLFPCAFKILTALMGYRTSPFALVLFTNITASTTMFEKSSQSLHKDTENSIHDAYYKFVFYYNRLKKSHKIGYMTA